MSVEELLDLLLFRAWLSHLNSFWAPGFGPPPRRPKLSFTSACRCLSQPKKVQDRWFRCERNASHFCLVKFDPFVDIIRQAIALTIVKTLCQADQDFCSSFFQAPGISRNSIVRIHRNCGVATYGPGAWIIPQTAHGMTAWAVVA